MKKIYITTPLYYVNDEPHIGHAYTTILADVLSKYYKMLNRDVLFLTGTDEHGQKVQEAAKKRNVSPKEHVDEYVKHFINIWDELQINYDYFIRTTDRKHKNTVKNILNSLWDKGDIYMDEYEGLYSVAEERFITQKEADEGNFREIKKIKEKNYFFKMSKYQNNLIKYIKSNPSFILPENRANEILGFLKKPLNDLCISRPKSRLEWGIEIPFDKNYVTYVWFDALINYISGISYNENSATFNKYWPADFQLIGKDILTTHAVYWSTMLMALNIPLPKTIFAHGWWLMEETKMSKSLGNVVKPLDIAKKYGIDSLRYFLMRDMVLGLDANFSDTKFIKRYNSDLANDYGNLINRVTMMIGKHFGSKIPNFSKFDEIDLELISLSKSTPEVVHEHFKCLRIHDAIETTLSLIRKINGYLEKRQPWKLLKGNNEDIRIASNTLYISIEVLRIGTCLLLPIMPKKCKEILSILGSESMNFKNLDFGLLKPKDNIQVSSSIFPRILTK